MDLSKLTMGEKIVLGTALVLVIDLVVLPWHSIDIILRSYKRTGIQSPGGGYGMLALLLTLAVAALVAVPRFTSAKLPDLPVPSGQAVFIGACAVAALLLLKLITETNFLGFGAYLGVLLGGGMAYGGFLVRKESGATAE